MWDLLYYQLMYRTILAVLLCVGLYGEPLRVSIKAPYALLMNSENGSILYEKRGYESAYPASTTKIATALYALHLCGKDLDREIKVPGGCLSKVTLQVKEARNFRLPPYWLEPDGTMMRFKKGDVLPLRSLIFGLMLASGNDAANVIAHSLAIDIPTFMRGLNAYLKGIGCKQTHFDNPHGLFYPTHQTTAYDLAIMTREALKYPFFREVVKSTEFECPYTKIRVTQHNPLVKPGKFFYEKAIGVKTGYIGKAGHCIVAAAEDQGRTLIAVVLGCKEKLQRTRDVLALFDAAFAETQETRKLYNQSEAFFKTSIQKRELKARLARDVVYTYYPSEEAELITSIQWEKRALPILKGEKVGELLIEGTHGETLFREPLYAEESIAKPSLIWIWFLFLPPLLIPILIKLPRKLRWFFNRLETL